jgi:hypothetical protein
MAGRTWLARKGGGVVVAIAVGLAVAVSGATAGPSGRPDTSAPSVGAARADAAANSPASGADSGGSGVVQARVAVSSITLAVALSQRAARAGQPVRIDVRLVNRSAATLQGLVVTLVVDPDGLSVRPGGPRLIRRLGPGAEEAISWIACGRNAGTYSITVEAVVGDARVRSASAPLTITSSGTC